MSSMDELNAKDLEPRGVDRSVFNSGALGISSSARDWQKSPAGRACLAGINGNTIVGPTRERMSPAEYHDKYKS